MGILSEDEKRDMQEKYVKLLMSGAVDDRVEFRKALLQHGITFREVAQTIKEGMEATKFSGTRKVPDHKVRLVAASMAIEHLIPPEERSSEVEDFMKMALEKIEGMMPRKMIEGIVIEGEAN